MLRTTTPCRLSDLTVISISTVVECPERGKKNGQVDYHLGDIVPARGYLRHNQHRHAGLDHYRRWRRHKTGSHVVVHDLVQQTAGLFQIGAGVGMDDGTGLHIYWLHSDYGNHNTTGDLALGPHRHSLRTLGRIRRHGAVLSRGSYISNGIPH